MNSSLRSTARRFDTWHCTIALVPDESRGFFLARTSWHRKMLPQLKTRFEAIEASKAALLERLSRIEPRLLAQPPQGGAWSLAQIAQHLMLVEEEIVRQLKKPDFDQNRRQGLRDWIGRAMVHFVFRRGIRVKVPIPSVVPLRKRSFDEVWQRWDGVRSDLVAYLNGLQEHDLHRMVFRHPVAGRMNVLQTLDLLELHLRHHQRQIDRTERDVTR